MFRNLYSRLKIILLFFLLTVFVISNVSAKDNISINADTLEYQSDRKKLVATGNVLIKYKKFKIKTDDILIDNDKKCFSIKGPYSVLYDGSRLDGKGLYFEYLNNYGKGKNVEILSSGRTIKGQQFTITSTNILIDEGYFTTCGEESKHYSFKADSINIYPIYGLIVLKGTSFNLGNVPVIIIPYFIVASPKYSVLGSQTTIPEIGINEEDGFYVKERFGYFLNSTNTGTLDLEYYAKRGVRFGFSHQNITSDLYAKYISLHFYTGKQYPENMEFDLIFENIWGRANNPGKEESSSDGLDDIFMPDLKAAGKPLTRSEIELSYRKYLNKEYVTFIPRIYLDINDLSFNDILFLKPEFELARIKENDKEPMNKFRTKLNLYRSFALNKSNDLSFGLNLNYARSRHIWNQLIGKINYSYSPDDKNLYFDVNYEHIFDQSGRRSFEYERYKTFDTDNIEFEFGGKLKHWETNLRYKYRTDDFKLLDSEISLSYNMDCMKIGLGYSFYDKEFQYILSLL